MSDTPSIRRCTSVVLVLFSLAFAAAAHADVFNMPSGQTSLQFVTVGDPGNVADTATGGIYGSVPYIYQMGTYDVTLAQYTTFLNSVATSDPYGLYNSYMGTEFSTLGIAQNGSPGSYSYSVTGSAPGVKNMPVFDVSWGDAARFTNWLQNGQTTGPEGNGTTETGAYTLSGATTDAALLAVTRNAGATYFIPSENEWYKAAYFDPTLNGDVGGYWQFPTKSNTVPGNTLPDKGNSANYDDGYTDPNNYLTPVGSFVLSPGPFGTYDMGGDVFQWNEAVISDSYRGLRGGAWADDGPDVLRSLARYNDDPTLEGNAEGFRVAGSVPVPEPGGAALASAAGACLLAFAWRRHVKNSQANLSMPAKVRAIYDRKQFRPIL